MTDLNGSHSLSGVAARLAEADDAAVSDTAAVIAPFNAAFLEWAPERLVDLIGSGEPQVPNGPHYERDLFAGPTVLIVLALSRLPLHLPTNGQYRFLRESRSAAWSPLQTG